MRAHNDEHSDNLPIIDISALRHVAYVFDALIYYMRSGTDSDADMIRDGISVHSWQDHDENDNEDQEDEVVGQNVTMETDSMDGESDVGLKSGRKHPFFQRTDSTTFLGCPAPDPFHGRLPQTLPLADQPQLLQPNSRREDLFGMPRQTIVVPTTGVNSTSDTDTAGTSTTPDPPTLPTPPAQNAFDRLPTHLALSTRMVDTPYAQGPSLLGFHSTTNIEVPSCSAPTPSTSHTESNNGASTSVIVKPGSSTGNTQSGRFFPTFDASPQSVPMNLSADLSSTDRAPVNVASMSVPMEAPTPVSTVPPAPPAELPAPVVTQPSVIVHAGSAQPIVLPPTGASSKSTSEEENKDPKPSTSAAVPMETSSTAEQPSTSTAAEM